MMKMTQRVIVLVALLGLLTAIGCASTKGHDPDVTIEQQFDFPTSMDAQTAQEFAKMLRGAVHNAVTITILGGTQDFRTERRTPLDLLGHNQVPVYSPGDPSQTNEEMTPEQITAILEAIGNDEGQPSGAPDDIPPEPITGD